MFVMTRVLPSFKGRFLALNYLFMGQKSTKSSLQTSSQAKKYQQPKDTMSNEISIDKSKQVIIPPSGKHTSTLIFLHGLGDTGHGWASSLHEIRPLNLKIVCPTAPSIKVTLNSGFKMPAWFDLFSLYPNCDEDEEGIKRASGWVSSLIEEELSNGITENNILLGGFSQGGALALYSGLTSKRKLGGIIALSCWMPLHKEITKLPLNTDTPILQCHGDCDPVVQYKWGQQTSTILKTLKMKTHDFKTYRGLGHSSAEEEMMDVKSFIVENMQKQSS